MKELKLDNADKVAFVDDEDYPIVVKYKWKLNSEGYAETSISWGIKISLHQFILDNKKWFDHKDRNKLNCCRSNLRKANNSLNQANSPKRKGNFSSKYKGVYFDKRVVSKPWRAVIRINKIKTHIGHYKEEILAAIAYDDKAILTFGEFALLNLPIYGA